MQYHQAMRTKTRFAFLAKKQLLLQYRPVKAVRPGADARAWWKYALILLTNRGDVLANKVGSVWVGGICVCMCINCIRVLLCCFYLLLLAYFSNAMSFTIATAA